MVECSNISFAHHHDSHFIDMFSFRNLFHVLSLYSKREISVIFCADQPYSNVYYTYAWVCKLSNRLFK